MFRVVFGEWTMSPDMPSVELDSQLSTESRNFPKGQSELPCSCANLPTSTCCVQSIQLRDNPNQTATKRSTICIRSLVPDPIAHFATYLAFDTIRGDAPNTSLQAQLHHGIHDRLRR